MKPTASSVAILAVLLMSNLAQAQARRSEQLKAQAQRLAAVESQLNRDDRESIEHYIEKIDRVISGYHVQAQAGAAPLVCLSNGQQGNYERFTITDAAAGVPVEKGTSMATCKLLLTVQNQGLICASNGEQGNYERFGVYDLARKAVKGGRTNIKSCQALVTGAKGPFVCQSNGEQGNYEKFVLYNRDTDKALGGGTTLEQCLAAIPN